MLQVCNAVYVRLNFTQPLCACPSRYRDPCSASNNADDLHSTELITDPRGKVSYIAHKAKQKYVIHPSLWVTGYFSAAKMFKRKARSETINRWRTAARGGDIYWLYCDFTTSYTEGPPASSVRSFTVQNLTSDLLYNAHRLAMQDQRLSKGLYDHE